MKSTTIFEMIGGAIAAIALIFLIVGAVSTKLFGWFGIPIVLVTLIVGTNIYSAVTNRRR